MIRVALREVLLIAACVILTGTLGLIVVDTVVMPRIVRKGLQVEVPDIVDQTPEQAKRSLSPRGLRLELSEPRWDDSIPEGRLVFQSPPAYSLVKPNRTVYAIPSLGVQLFEVPDLRKLMLRQAQLKMAQAGLILGEIKEEAHPLIKEGHIIYHDPPPGKKVEYGSALTIILSTGREREMVFVPNVVGRKIDAAREALAALELTVKDTRYAFSTAYLPNTVTRQEPKAGEEVKRGTAIRLVVSKL